MCLLSENWNKIQKKVILPLWHSKFRPMYEMAKLDYNDFESLAGFELTKAMESFDPEKSNIFTYSTKVITQKAMTELRNCTQRDRRKALHTSESIDFLIEQNDVLPFAVDDNFEILESSNDALSNKMVAYLNRLSTLQKQVLYAMADGYSNDEIKTRLNITPNELADAVSAIRSYRNVSLLY